MDNLEAYRQVVEQRDEHAGHVEHLMRVVEGQRNVIQKLQGENNTLREKIRVDLHTLKNLVAHLEAQTTRRGDTTEKVPRGLAHVSCDQPMTNTVDGGCEDMSPRTAAQYAYDRAKKHLDEVMNGPAQDVSKPVSPPQSTIPQAQDHDFNERN